ncbi:MAG: hypothetical protein NTW96_02445 [Planctomycetia bacterium]|nr:hypothetical protein [Planctomycetia bacterium]
MSFNESTVEDAALSWFEELGYGVAHGEDIAPGPQNGIRNEWHCRFGGKGLRRGTGE